MNSKFVSLAVAACASLILLTGCPSNVRSGPVPGRPGMCYLSITTPGASAGGTATGAIGADGNPTATAGVEAKISWTTKTYIGKCSDPTPGTEVGSSTPPALTGATPEPDKKPAAASGEGSTPNVIPAVNNVTQKLIGAVNNAKTGEQKAAANELLADSVEFYKAIAKIKNPEPYRHSTSFNQAIAELQNGVTRARATAPHRTVAPSGSTSHAIDLPAKPSSERLGIMALDHKPKALAMAVTKKTPTVRATTAAVLKKANDLVVKAERLNPR